jgi:signal transduction histidine kinase/DNA-binding NarL/FixJ family response regulator
MRILLVEDEPGDARLVREMIRDIGDPSLDLEVADRLATACDRIASDAFDAVLLDLGLPDGNGLEALERCMGPASGVAVVVLTGRDDTATALEALRRGAQDFLIKGHLDAPLLARTLHFAVERKRLQTADHVMAETARQLAGTMDLAETVSCIGAISVRTLADFCIIDIAGEDGVLRRVHVSCADPTLAAEAERLSRYPVDRRRSHVTRSVIESRKPLLARAVEPAQLAGAASDPELVELLTTIGLRSYIAVPLVAREHLMGVIILLSSRRDYHEGDLELVERLARAAALEIDNANLYRSAREAVRARDSVLAVVAHDLRNPLSAISMCAELLLGEELDAEQRLRQLQIVRRSAERMDRLIQDLLDVARIESGRLVLETAHLDPAGIVREAVELNAAIAAAQSLELHCETVGVPGPVRADRERVHRVLANLVANAIRFTPAGGTVVVRAEPTEDEPTVRFSVIDSGTGVAAEDLPNLFVPFWQSQRGQGGGAGLGLAIAQGIVEAHGGRIWAESPAGKGATLSFTLPLAPERRAPSGAPGAAPGEGPAAAAEGD